MTDLEKDIILNKIDYSKFDIEKATDFITLHEQVSKEIGDKREFIKDIIKNLIVGGYLNGIKDGKNI